VQASTASQAMNAVTKETYDIKVATGIEVADLVRAGAPVIQAATPLPKEPLTPTPAPELIPEDGGKYGDYIGGGYRTQAE